ncbi:hypothetical protein DW202_04945 [Coprobacillus sp. AM17-34]|nr:hypothetical protein DW202_04945 [Coprobacillus sp. AM17-34]
MINFKDISKNDKLLMIIMALLPILSPYAIKSEGMSISNVIIIFVCFVSIVKERNLRASRLWLTLLFVLVIESFVAMTFSGNNIKFSLAIRVSIMFFIYLFAYGYIWEHINKDFFIYIIIKIGIFCAILAIIQFVFVSAGISNFYTGKLPLPLSQYSEFGSLIDITGSIRVHSFFEEPSYLALYEIPIFAYCLQNKKYKTAAILSIACILSGTVLGIIGVITVSILIIIIGDISINRKFQLIGIIIIVLIGFIILYFSNDAIQNIFNYYIGRYNHIGKDLNRDTSSVSQRLLGNIILFSKYNIFNKFFGVGINQYANYFGLSSDYSNDLVCILLNYGIFGIVFLIFIILNILKNIKKQGLIQIVFFIIVLAVDHIWFNEYFFYILTWIAIYTNNRKQYIILSFKKVK